MKEKRLSGIGTGIVLAACFSFLMFVYAPLELYITNISEFWVKLSELVFPIVALFFLSFIGLTAALIISRLINENFYSVCLAIGFSLLLGAYIQGNFLVKNLPSMDGLNFVWSDYPLERLKSVLAFVLPLIILIIILIKIKSEKFKKIVSVASTCFIILFVITLTTLFITTDTKKSDAVIATVSDEFKMSSDQNLVMLVLDTVNCEDFEKALKNDPEYEETFDGFTFFDNALAAYPHTKHAVPIILSGKWYKNDSNFTEYQIDAINNSPVFTTLAEQKYHTGLYEKSTFVLPKESCEVKLDNYSSVKVAYDSSAIYQFVIKLGGVKFFPWDMKNYCWYLEGYSQYFQKFESDTESFKWEDDLFYSEISERNPITVVNEKCARIIHLQGAHFPFAFDKELNKITSGSYEQNIEACYTLVKKYINRLKESSVYDNSAIVILGDHGYNGVTDGTYDSLKGRMNPLLMVKGVNEKHNIGFSDAPVSYEDIADSIKNLLSGKMSTEIFNYSDGDTRTRKTILYFVNDSNTMIEYITNGRADDIDAMKPSGEEYKR